MAAPHTVLAAGAAAQVREQGAQERAQHFASEPSVPSTSVAERIRQGEDPLAHGYFGKHALDQVGCCIRHPTSATGWTEAAPFAGKGYQAVVATPIAMHPQEAVGEHATSELGAKFALHEASDRRVLLASAGQEGFDVLSDNLVEQSLLRLVT